jgi:hypothetical protein
VRWFKTNEETGKCSRMPPLPRTVPESEHLPSSADIMIGQYAVDEFFLAEAFITLSEVRMPLKKQCGGFYLNDQ